jgi:DNA invertase Pin-like site-specific DNA recombinase
MKHVILYARVSTAHHDQNPEVQLHELRSYCGVRGWKVLKEIADHGFSGGTDRRPGLQELLHLVNTGEADCVIVLKLDRLFRSLRQLVTTLDDFQSKGVAFVAVKDAVDYTSPAGKLFTQILGSLAEFEKALIRERTIAGLEYARNVKGKRLGGPKQVHNSDLMLHLRSQGLSTRAIARLLGCSHSTVARELKSAVTETSDSSGEVQKLA